MARTGFLIVIYQDVNPSSPTYNQTREERTQSEEFCPSSAPANWIEDTKYCELTENGMLTGYEITVYRDVEPLSPTYDTTREERELNLEECEADEDTPNWQNIGDPFCRQTVYMPGGLMGNDGYMIQQQQDMNEYSPTADEIREIETLDLTNCPLPNTLPDWEVIYEACHIIKQDGQLMFDGTKDVVRINRNQYSPSWNDNIPETVNIEDLITCPPDIEVQYRWVVVAGEYMCVGYDKHSVEKKQRSTDGETWVDVMPLQTRAGALIEANSEDCGYEPTIEYRWVVVDEQYICVGFDKHAMEKKQQSSDGGTTWTDVTPTETRAGELIEANSEDCGYQPTFEYRWVVITGQYECVGYDKYSVEKKQQSSDGGQNWTDVEPLQTRTGSLIERNSTDCGYLEPQYRWVAISGTFVCVGYDKHQQEKQQVSYDNGTTWEDVVPANTRTGSLIEHNSDDCGYIPETVYRWITISGQYVCVGFDKYTMEKKQQSIDGGTTWTDVVPTETRAGELVEANSEYCGYTDFTTFDCGIIFTDLNTNDHHFSTNSGARFELLNTQVNNANGYIRVNFRIHIKKNMSNYDWVVRDVNNLIAAYRNIGTVTEGQVITDFFEVPCGSYNFMLMIQETIGDTTLMYAQSRLTYICNDCSQTPVYTTRWITDSVDYLCNGVDKYTLEREQYYQNDEWWYTSKEREGVLIEADSEDCGYEPTYEYRWVEISGQYECVGYDKYSVEKKQQSSDGGTTWTDVVPTETRTGSLIERNSTDCGYVPPTPSYETQYLTFEAIENGTYTFTDTDVDSLQYSLDNGTTWTPLASGVASPIVTSGNKILWKGNYTSPTSSGIGKFSSNGTFKVYGNIMSLVYGDNFQNQTTISSYHFWQLFKDIYVVDASNLILPATTLTQRCYSGMFNGCTSLTSAPALPATTLAQQCYYAMFYGCTSLATAPQLPATTLAEECYLEMFRGCTNLVNTPSILPATTLTSGCYYYMFAGCTSLTTAPQLPATTLANNCYNSMFFGCTSLVNAPALPATTLEYSCYNGMFYGCTNLATAPVLSATILTERCYYEMFRECTSLTTAPALPATTLAYYCYYRMFYHCTSLVNAPSILPATTLTSGCYNGMFTGCTSLTTAPELPATTLIGSCYYYMFQDCTSLNYIKAMFTTTPSMAYTDNWVSGVASSGTFVKNSAATWNVRGVNGIPSGWTIQNQ